MTTYLLLNGQLRAETDEAAIANLRRKGWVDAPAKPSDDAQWQNGAWVVPPAPTYTPEQWTSQHFSPMQVSALARFEMALMQAGKPLGPLMTALKAWLEGMLVASVDPTPRSDWQQPPCSYETASAEAVSDLNS